MKHFRPIKTFGTWLLESVEIKVPYTRANDDCDEYKTWIEQTLGLFKHTHGNLSPDLYMLTGMGLPVRDADNTYQFHFPTAEHADAFQARFGGVRKTRHRLDSLRVNEGIRGNFTLDDLVYLYGSPLPNIIQYHLVDMADRLTGYFHEYKFMHQTWGDRQWLPSAFVYINEKEYDDRDILGWLHSQLHADDTIPSDWQKGWHGNGNGIYEFDDPAIAVLFKLRFGGASIPSKLPISRLDAVKGLLPHVSGIKTVGGRNGIWEKQANIPDYRSPRVVD